MKEICSKNLFLLYSYEVLIICLYIRVPNFSVRKMSLVFQHFVSVTSFAHNLDQSVSEKMKRLYRGNVILQLLNIDSSIETFNKKLFTSINRVSNGIAADNIKAIIRKSDDVGSRKNEILSKLIKIFLKICMKISSE